MENSPQENKNQTPADRTKNDSLGVPVVKSPWLIYALLQIPIVIIMVVLMYFGYQRFKEGM